MKTQYTIKEFQLFRTHCAKNGCKYGSTVTLLKAMDVFFKV